MSSVRYYGKNSYLDDYQRDFYIEYRGYDESWFEETEIDGETVYMVRSYHITGLFDSGDLLDRLEESGDFPELAPLISDARAALGSIVIYNTTAGNEERSHGLSLFCPMSEDFAYPEEETEFETWRKLTAFD